MKGSRNPQDKHIRLAQLRDSWLAEPGQNHPDEKDGNDTLGALPAFRPVVYRELLSLQQRILNNWAQNDSEVATMGLPTGDRKR